MKIKKAVLLKSIGNISQYTPSSIPEIAMVGRSNVGKSSLINFICNNRKLARVAQTPGKTKLVNMFHINDSFYLVDLPGYGYAEAAKGKIKAWSALIDSYLESTESLKEIFHLIDSRHLPTEDDKQMVRYMIHYNIPFCHIATKCDKLSRAQLNKNIREIAAALGVPPTSIIPVSSEKNIGIDALLDRIESVLTRDGEI